MQLTTYLLRQIWQDTTLLLVITSVILLTLTEILSTKYGKINMQIDRTKVKNSAIIIGIIALTSLIILIIGSNPT